MVDPAVAIPRFRIRVVVKPFVVIISSFRDFLFTVSANNHPMIHMLCHINNLLETIIYSQLRYGSMSDRVHVIVTCFYSTYIYVYMYMRTSAILKNT